MKDKSILYYLILFSIWIPGFIVICVVPLKLIGSSLNELIPKSIPTWFGILYFITAIVGAIIVAVPLTNRIAAKFISKEAMLEIIRRNILPYSPFYKLVIRDIEKIYQKRDVDRDN